MDWRCIRGSVLAKRHSMLYWLTLFIESLLLDPRPECNAVVQSMRPSWLHSLRISISVFSTPLSRFSILQLFLICFEKLKRHAPILRVFFRKRILCVAAWMKLNFRRGMQMRYADAAPRGKSRSAKTINSNIYSGTTNLDPHLNLLTAFIKNYCSLSRPDKKSAIKK